MNPYKFGMVGSTDRIPGSRRAEENNFFGKASNAEPSAGRAMHLRSSKNPQTGLEVMGWEASASGYAARMGHGKHPRVDLFDAMQRKETLQPRARAWSSASSAAGTSSRSDAKERASRRKPVTQGRADGRRPEERPAGKSPTFLVAAMKDPMGANLDRIQVVKGWLDAKGETHEHVYDVVWSDPARRKPGADGKVPAVGGTVDVKNATWTDTIGASDLIAVWKDPQFDPKQSAFYYVRVLQIPTPRWTAYDAKYFNVQMGKEVTMCCRIARIPRRSGTRPRQGDAQSWVARAGDRGKYQGEQTFAVDVH